MATSTPKEKPKKSSKLILLVIALAVLVIAAGGAAAYFYLGAKQPPKETVALPVDPIFVALEPFTVNLQPNGRARFLHVALTLKVADAASQTQLTQYLPEVRSRVLTVLSNRESESLLAADEKSRLANEVMASLNQPFAPNLASAKIASVMFTTFMLQ
jgi:flagellar FliL protein